MPEGFWILFSNLLLFGWFENVYWFSGYSFIRFIKSFERSTQHFRKLFFSWFKFCSWTCLVLYFIFHLSDLELSNWLFSFKKSHHACGNQWLQESWTRIWIFRQIPFWRVSSHLSQDKMGRLITSKFVALRFV